LSCEAPDPDELAQPRIEPDPVELLGGHAVEVAHRARELSGVRIEVEAGQGSELLPELLSWFEPRVS